MRIHAMLMRDNTEIGTVHCALVTPDDPEPDDECVYGWLVDLEGRGRRSSNELGLVRHRHGDGEWALVAKVLKQAGYGGDAHA